MSYHCAYLKENEIKVTMAPGGSGLSSVAHDETLIGKGTNKNPLGVDTTIIAKKSDIPTPITEENVRDWGFTKNTGNYNKPQTGIPKTDLASDVQTSLEKANTALQEHQDITGKVDKIEGKGLSTNDYTNEEKDKLSQLENYDDTEIKVLINEKQDKGDYALRSDIPDVSSFITKTVTDLVNYYNKNETYTQAEIKALIEAVKAINMEIVPAKPDEPKSNIIYLISNGKAGNNIYDEYVYVNNKWELIGSTDIDLSNYYNKAEIDSKINIELSEEEKYTDMQTFANNLIEDFTASLNEKQNIITDLGDIRDGALKGSTALQSVPAEYITETELNNYHDSTKVDKEENKGLSTNDYTNEEKDKLSQLENYDDTQVKSEINTINEKIPTQATNNNQLADKDFVNSSLNSITAFYITKNANGDQFNNKAELNSTTEFYSGGELRVPTRNDYCIVLEDETKDNSTTRYIYQNGQWEFQYVVNETPLTSEQVKAINSGITPELVAKLQGIDLTNVVRDANYIHTDNNYTNQEKAKLAGLNNYDDTQIKEDISKKANKVLVIESITTTQEIQPNKFYKFGEVTELNLTLAEITDNTQLNEYMFEFVSGATATTLTLPSSVKWLETPTIEANKIYQCSIVNNIGVLLGVANV